jgi:PKD repeat protein
MKSRKSRLAVLFIIAAFGLAPGLVPAARAALNLSNSPATFSTCSRIAVDARGVIHVAWVEMWSEYSGDCFYARSEDAGRTWTAPTNLSRSAKVYCFGERICDIAADGQGGVYAVWAESNVLKLSAFVDGAWQSPLTVATARASMNTPKIVASDQGNIYIGWWTEDGIVYARAKVGGAWEAARALSVPGLRSKYPDIGLGRQYVYLAWMEGTAGGYRNVYAWRSAAAGSPWSPPGALPSTGNEEQHPIIVADANDVPFIIWSPELTAGGVRYIAFSRGVGGGFSPPERISSEGILHYPSLAIRGQTLFACWQTGSYRAGASINFNVRTDDAWAGEQAVPGSRGSTFSDIAASPTGDIVYVVWDAANDIYFARAVESQENLPPVADFKVSPPSGDVPLKAAFDASASYDPDGKIADYGWAFGDGTTGQGRTITHTYDRKGQFTVRLTVRDDRGAKGTATRTVEATKPNLPPAARFTFAPRTGDAPLEVSCDASGSSDPDGRIVSYSWTFGDGETGSGQTVEHSFAGDGTFAIGLTVIDDRGGQDRASHSIKVLKPNLPPVAAFSYSPSAGIAPLEVAFDASASQDSDGRIASYSWSFGDGAAGSGPAVRHTFALKGTYAVQLTVKDDRGGQAVREASLAVLNLAPPLNIGWQTSADRTLLFVRYITDVRWDENPANDAIASVVAYRVYRKKAQDAASAYRMIAATSASARGYRDSDVGGYGLYDYTVTAVDSLGHESPIEGI